MLKKILSVVFALFISIGVLAGCNLVSVNNTEYYTQIVAEVEYDGDRLSFTMKDLLTAYNNYGYQSVQQGTSTVKEAIDSTVTNMVNRAIMIEELKKAYPLTNAEKMQLRREAHARINETISEFENQIKEKANLLPGETLPEDEVKPEPLRKPYEAYKPNVVLNEENVLVKVNYDEEHLEEVSDEDYKIEPFVQERNDSVAKEAYKRYISQLKRRAESEGVKGKTDQELLEMEIESIYSVLESNKYITKFQESYLSNENVLNITADDVLNRYKALVNRDYALYSSNILAYHSAMRSDKNNVYYHPVANQYVQITHILVQLTDLQNANLNNLKEQLTETEFNSYMDSYLSNVKIKYNEWNSETESFEEEVSEKSFVLAYNEIKNAVLNANNLKDKAAAFDNYLYMYNDDPGIVNNEHAYVVNLTNDLGTQNIMIEEFTIAARELNVGEISQPVFTEYSTGKYGYHIIMNLGKVENLFSYENLDQVTLNDLYEKTIHPAGEKTLFHSIYDAVVQDKTNQRINEIILQAKGKTYKYEQKYRNLWS